jgi:hypothetical protein
MTEMKEITNSLNRLRAQNEREYQQSVMRQEIESPAALLSDTVPALSPNERKPMTQMLSARFEFAGRWRNAAFGQTWLSLRDMEDLWRNESILDALDSDRQYFDGHVLSLIPWKELSLFGIDLDDDSKSFLDWSDTSQDEPRVITYVGSSVFRYKDLQSAIDALLK